MYVIFVPEKNSKFGYPAQMIPKVFANMVEARVKINQNCYLSLEARVLP